MFERTRLGRQGIDPDRLEVVRVRVEPGSPAPEEIPVERIAEGRWRVLATPGLAQGFAADDEIEIAGDAVISVQRAGNIGVQILAEQHDRAAVTELLDKAEAIGGWLDGFEPHVAVLTFWWVTES